MPDTRWRIDDIEADGLESGQPTFTVGQRESLTFRFETTPAPTGTGYGEAAYGELLYGYGGNAQYADLVEYLEYADAVTVDTTIDALPLLSESLPERAPVESNIVLIDPVGADVAFVDPWWGVITGGSDDTPALGFSRTDRFVVTLEVTWLAPGDEYADRTELENDLTLLETPTA